MSGPLVIEVVTLFPRMFEAPLAEGVLGRARGRGLFEVRTRDLRSYGEGRHRVTDDTPYGGGAGMVMTPGPLVGAIEAAREALSERGPQAVLLDPQGVPFTQAVAQRWSKAEALVLVCGRYEGVDERVRAFVDETVSVGDFVLTGGELAALCVIDAVARLVPGVLGNESSPRDESFSEGLLEGPQYTRPMEFRGQKVPEVLVSGDHARIARWRRRQAIARTLSVRPEVLEALPLTDEDRTLVAELKAGRRESE